MTKTTTKLPPKVAKFIFDEGHKYSKYSMNVFAKTYIVIETPKRWVFKGTIETLIRKLKELK